MHIVYRCAVVLALRQNCLFLKYKSNQLTNNRNVIKNKGVMI